VRGSPRDALSLNSGDGVSCCTGALFQRRQLPPEVEKVTWEFGINRSLTIWCAVTKHRHFGYTHDATFPGFIQPRGATGPGWCSVLPLESTYYKMKTDYSFKLVTAIVFAGVIVAFFSPNHVAPRAENIATEVAPATATPLSE
jgi:hypothetical protein